MKTSLVIIAITLALSVGLAVLTHGHVIFIGLPLLIGVPLAGLLSRRR